MNFGELKAKLKKGNMSQLYLLSGEESYYIEKGEKAILAALFPNGYNVEDVQIVDGNVSINEIISMIETVPFFSTRNVIVFRDAAIFRAAKRGTEDEGDKAQAKKKDPAETRLCSLFANMPDFSVVIFEVRGRADKRKKLFKEFSQYAQIMEADAVKSYGVGDWLHGKLQEIHKNMNSEAHGYFLQAVEMMDKVSLGFLDKELDKLALFMGSEQREITKELLVQVFSDIPEIDGFAMNEAIGQQDVKRALFLFKKQQDKGVYIVAIIGQLAYYVRKLWQTKTMLKKGLRGGQLGKAIEINHPYVVKKYERECQSFSEATLKKALLALADADLAVKTGRGYPAQIEEIIIELCSKARAC